MTVTWGPGQKKSKMYDSVALEWDPRFCISNQFGCEPCHGFGNHPAKQPKANSSSPHTLKGRSELSRKCHYLRIVTGEICFSAGAKAWKRLAPGRELWASVAGRDGTSFSTKHHLARNINWCSPREQAREGGRSCPQQMPGRELLSIGIQPLGESSPKKHLNKKLRINKNNISSPSVTWK